MRWKAFLFLKDYQTDNNSEKDNSNDDDNLMRSKFKSRKCPPLINGLKEFERDITKLIENVAFRHIGDEFQRKLNSDIKKINESDESICSSGQNK